MKDTSGERRRCSAIKFQRYYYFFSPPSTIGEVQSALREALAPLRVPWHLNAIWGLASCSLAAVLTHKGAFGLEISSNN